MIIQINTDLLGEHAISGDDYIFIKLISLGNYNELSMLNLTPNIQQLIDDDFIKGFPDQLTQVELTDKGFSLLDIINADEELDKLTILFTQLWENTKPGSLSTPISIKNRLTRFCTLFPQYNIETIKVAAAYYVGEMRKNSGFKFMKSTSNFILERDNFDDIQSMLSSFCQSVMSGDTDDQYQRA